MTAQVIAFQTHVAGCDHCKQNPTRLCDDGKRTLREAIGVTAAADTPGHPAAHRLLAGAFVGAMNSGASTRQFLVELGRLAGIMLGHFHQAIDSPDREFATDIGSWCQEVCNEASRHRACGEGDEPGVPLSPGPGRPQ